MCGEEMKSTARKELSRTEENGKETIVNEIIHFDFDGSILDDLKDIFGDGEYEQEHGVFFDKYEEIHSIDVYDCIMELNERTFDDDDYTKEMRIIAYLEKYKEFKIWV